LNIEKAAAYQISNSEFRWRLLDSIPTEASPHLRQRLHHGRVDFLHLYPLQFSNKLSN
jgi:hypothetical protein